MKSVKKLPSEVSSLVRSGVIIPTPSQAIEELVLNSIDAEASSIAVRVDLRLFKIQVIDNGHGISYSDLELVGNRFITSKCFTLDEFYNNLTYHGYRGEALASLREMCGLLEIVSRSTGNDNTYSKLFVHGKEEKIKASDLNRPSCGTTVTLTDFMYNMPVRRGKMKEAVEIEAIRSCIEYIALAHPQVSISIRNDAKGRTILEKHKSNDILDAFKHLFGHNLARTLAPINFSTEKFKINGYISKEAYRHSDLQFIYINKQSIVKTKVHKLVTVLLSKSSIIRTNGPWKNKPIPKHVPPERWLSFPSLEKQKKFAVFIINITCARKEYEMCWDSKKPLIYFKDWDCILSCLNNAIQEFLKLEGLVEEEENVSAKKFDKEEIENSLNKKPLCGKASLSVLAQPCEDTLSKHDKFEEYEVETWNIQGAVHGICAKRPKENSKIQQKMSEEKNNDKKEFEVLNRRKLSTPGSKQSGITTSTDDLWSVPPVVKFLKKIETPPEFRLNITKAAYHLKKMEEEEKKLKNAEKFSQFKCSSKPKLKCLINNKNHTKTKSFSKESTNDEIFPKVSTFRNLKIESKLNKKVNKPSHLYDSISREEFYNGVHKSTDGVNDINILQDESSVSIGTESVNLESSNVSCSFSSVELNDCPKKNIEMQCFSCDTNNSPGQDVSEVNRRQYIYTIVDEENSRKYSSFDVTDKTYKLLNNSPKSSMNSFDDRFPSENGKKLGGLLNDNVNATCVKHSNRKSPYFGSKKHKYIKKRSSSTVNLEVSKTMTISIPTPQPRSISTSTTSPSLKNKADCFLRFSKENQLSVTENLKNNICSPEPPQHTMEKPNVPKPNVVRQLIAQNSCEEGADELGNSTISPVVLHNSEKTHKQDTLKDTQNMTHSFISVPPLQKNSSVTCSPFFHNIEPKKNVSASGNETLSSSEKTFRDETANFVSLKAGKDFSSSFQLFERSVSNNIVGSKSPYFNFNKKLVCNNTTFKLYNFELENVDHVDKNYDENDPKNNNKIMDESNDLLLLSAEHETNQICETFCQSYNENKGTEFNKGVFSNVSYSKYSPVKDIFEELKNSEEKSITPEIIPALPFTEDSILFSWAKNEHDESAVTKRRRLSPNKPDNVVSIEDKAEISGELSSKESAILRSENKPMNLLMRDNSVLHEKIYLENEIGDRLMGEDWLQMRNFEGKLFYFNPPSGLTSFNAPSIAKDASLFTMSKRSEFLPKGMSPLLAVPVTSLSHSFKPLQSVPVESSDNGLVPLKDKDDLTNVKWREKPKPYMKDISDVIDVTGGLSSKKAMSSNTVIPDLSFMSAKMSGLLLQEKFDKRIFGNIQVVGQLDNKFIITLCSLDKHSSPHVIGIFDQHAVDERIRLESLMKGYLSNEDEWTFKSTDLTETIELIVSAREYNIMSNFQEKFEKLGLHFTVEEDSTIKVHQVPTCLYSRFLRERSRQWLEGTIQNLIQDIVQFLIKTGGQDSVVPEVFKDVINSEACKGAIKFGDPLSITKCVELLSLLSKCNLPFFCAHGRPSFMPILDLRQFEIERKKYVPGC